MKLAAAIFLSALLVIVGVQIYSFIGKDNQAKQDLLDFQAKLNKAKADQSKSQEEMDYYSNPNNLEKELRARFNYRSSDEKLMILVPKTATSTTQ